jgi:multisubunit Na+/H+ antiporter MnhE subunit
MKVLNGKKMINFLYVWYVILTSDPGNVVVGFIISLVILFLVGIFLLGRRFGTKKIYYIDLETNPKFFEITQEDVDNLQRKM